MADLDVNTFLNTSMKDDPLVEPAEPEEGPSGSNSSGTKAASATIHNDDPPLQDQEIGPEDGLIQIRFPVIKIQFVGQRQNAKGNNWWHVRGNTRGEMLANVWKLAAPHVKRAVEFPASNEPCWSEKEVPDRTDLALFVVIRCNSGRRTFKLDQIEEERWRKWATQNNLLLIVYQYSHQIHSKAAWDLVVDRLLTPGATPKKPALVGEELKLDTMLKRLKRLHQERLVPKKEDAFEQWARWILKSPQRRHSTLSSSMPPGELLKNFVLVKQTNGKSEESSKRVQKPTRRRYISGPAQREHTTDGFGFEDEVKILRQTVTQIRDLVEMLDYRVGLLEEKCQGFRQAVQGNGEPPKKKVKKEEGEVEKEEEDSGSEDSDEDDDDDDDDGENNAGYDDEPLVNEDGDASDDGGDKDWVNPDPLLFNDLVEVKEEESMDVND